MNLKDLDRYKRPYADKPIDYSKMYSEYTIEELQERLKFHKEGENHFGDEISKYLIALIMKRILELRLIKLNDLTNDNKTIL
jgi:hypothetical protein